MIYLETSVALAHLLTEDRSPPGSLWEEALVASRLLEYEIWNRVNARGRSETLGEAVRQLTGRVAMIELGPSILVRALDPFPKPVRTLDALHLASMDFLRRQGQEVVLASYDRRLRTAARQLDFSIYDLGEVQ
ncbi:MAG: PIN domain-containing protein [Gemmatimonadota bacterium]